MFGFLTDALLVLVLLLDTVERDLVTLFCVFLCTFLLDVTFLDVFVLLAGDCTLVLERVVVVLLFLLVLALSFDTLFVERVVVVRVVLVVPLLLLLKRVVLVLVISALLRCTRLCIERSLSFLGDCAYLLLTLVDVLLLPNCELPRLPLITLKFLTLFLYGL